LPVTTGVGSDLIMSSMVTQAKPLQQK